MTQRSAIVTGVNGGLGAPTAQRLVRAGFAVVGLDRRSPSGASSDGPDDDITRVEGNILDDADVHAAIAAATERGPLSVVVNVAGGSGAGRATIDEHGVPHDADAFTKALMINVVGTFNVCRLAAAAMAANEPNADGQRGVIVNTSSIAANEGQRGQVAYAASKAAVAAMTLPMARDLAAVGIRVCTIAPGPMGTPALLALREHLLEDPAAGVLFPPRLGEPIEFANLVAHLVENGYLNGATVRLDGGLRLSAGGD